MNCKLHQNQRKSGTLCGSSECGACLPFRKPASPLMGVTPPTDPQTGATLSGQPSLINVEPAIFQTQLDREVAADRALYIERRVMLASMAMQGLLAEGGSGGGAWRQRCEDAIAQRAVAHADALLTALFPTKFPSE